MVYMARYGDMGIEMNIATHIYINVHGRLSTFTILIHIFAFRTYIIIVYRRFLIGMSQDIGSFPDNEVISGPFLD